MTIRVLVIDDDETVRSVLESFLADQGWDVACCSDGLSGIEAYGVGGAFDIVLLDLSMPEMDGIDAIKAIRADKTIAHLYIVALTSFAMEEDESRCLAAGANEYKSKPIGLQAVLDIVEGRLP